MEEREEEGEREWKKVKEEERGRDVKRDLGPSALDPFVLAE